MTLPLNNTSLQEDIDDNDDENNELYEHFRVVADRGQQLLRVVKFLQDICPTHRETASNWQHALDSSTSTVNPSRATIA